MFNPYGPSTKIIMESTPLDKKNYGKEYSKVRMILEDANSPITAKYKEKLYQSVINKSHIDFGNIPESKGNIRDYKGYNDMMETLHVISELGKEEKSNVVNYVDIIKEAISNIEGLASVYAKGFDVKSEYVMLEYNTYVYTCVEATTTLIYEFVDYVKRPDMKTYEITLKNTKLRADAFYFKQLSAFNNINKTMHINYRKMLESMISNGRNNFTGIEEIVGITAVSMVVLAIVPITRELIYHFYNLRANLSTELDIMANFLEMNKVCVESNYALTEDKKKQVLTKQENLRKKIIKISDVLRVKEAKATKQTKRDIESANKSYSVNKIKDEISNSSLEIL